MTRDGRDRSSHNTLVHNDEHDHGCDGSSWLLHQTPKRWSAHTCVAFFAIAFTLFFSPVSSQLLTDIACSGELISATPNTATYTGPLTANDAYCIGVTAPFTTVFSVTINTMHWIFPLTNAQLCAQDELGTTYQKECQCPGGSGVGWGTIDDCPATDPCVKVEFPGDANGCMFPGLTAKYFVYHNFTLGKTTPVYTIESSEPIAYISANITKYDVGLAPIETYQYNGAAEDLALVLDFPGDSTFTVYPTVPVDFTETIPKFYFENSGSRYFAHEDEMNDEMQFDHELPCALKIFQGKTLFDKAELYDAFAGTVEGTTCKSPSVIKYSRALMSPLRLATTERLMDNICASHWRVNNSLLCVPIETPDLTLEVRSTAGVTWDEYLSVAIPSITTSECEGNEDSDYVNCQVCAHNAGNDGAVVFTASVGQSGPISHNSITMAAGTNGCGVVQIPKEEEQIVDGTSVNLCVRGYHQAPVSCASKTVNIEAGDEDPGFSEISDDSSDVGKPNEWWLSPTEKHPKRLSWAANLIIVASTILFLLLVLLVLALIWRTACCQRWRKRQQFYAKQAEQNMLIEDKKMDAELSRLTNGDKPVPDF